MYLLVNIAIYSNLMTDVNIKNTDSQACTLLTLFHQNYGIVEELHNFFRLNTSILILALLSCTTTKLNAKSYNGSGNMLNM